MIGGRQWSRALPLGGSDDGLVGTMMKIMACGESFEILVFNEALCF